MEASRSVMAGDRGDQQRGCGPPDLPTIERFARAARQDRRPRRRRRAMRRWAPAAAFLLAALGMAEGFGALAYLVIPLQAGVPGPGVSPVEIVLFLPFFIITPLIGWLLASRRPDNPIGWLFLLLAAGLALEFLADGFVRHQPPNATTSLVATVALELGSLGFAALFLVVQLFPTGRLPSRRWRALPALAIFGSTISSLAGLFSAHPFRPDIPGLPLPLAHPEWQPLVDAANTLATIALFIALPGTVALVVSRFRRSVGVERQQLKWFAWAAMILSLLLGTSVATSPLGLSNLFWQAALASMSLLPAASAIAILRYRLYDIDRIISRTVSYAVLSAILAGVYVVGFLAIQALLTGFTRSGGPVAVAASTLAVFALFSPIRRRVQAAVDRRFYRSRYDAAREIEGFAARVRDEVEVGRLTVALATTLKRTMQPASASIWLRSRNGP